MGFIISYNTVFDLSVWHDHFLAPGPADTFNPPPVPADFDRLLPYRTEDFVHWAISEETAQTVANKGLIFKQNRYGCLFAAKTSFSEPDADVKITLLGNLRDPDFLQYTKLGFDVAHPKQGHILYLYNKGLTANAGRTNLSRSPGNFLDLANNYFPWQTRIVRLPQLVPGTSDTVNVFDATSAALTPVTVIQAISGPDQPDYELDCRFLPSGLYRFESGNLNTTTLYIGQEHSSGNVLVAVDIYLAGTNGNHYDIRFDHN